MFDFFANPGNDKLWRTEINQTQLNGALQLGVTAAEYSYLSEKVLNNLLELSFYRLLFIFILTFSGYMAEKTMNFM